jgi:GNAT superfamily N-acetyltransferase
VTGSMTSLLDPLTVRDPYRVEAPSVHELGELNRVDLSPRFNAFLAHFAAEALRSGGEVRFVREGPALIGLLLADPVERVGSVLTRSRPLALSVVQSRSAMALFTEFAFSPPGETFEVLSVRFDAPTPPHVFRHRVRAVGPSDIPRVVDLAREVYGVANDRWFRDLDGATESGFLIEVDGELAGMGWVDLAGRAARLHSLAVRAHYRHLGAGTDLLFARLLWARHAGALEAISEIAERNTASRTIAVAGGMSPVGHVYLHPPG